MHKGTVISAALVLNVMSLLNLLINVFSCAYYKDVPLSAEDAKLLTLSYNGTGIDPEKPNITIGFLSHFQGIGKLIAGAIPLAVNRVNEDPDLLPDHNLRFIAYDSGKPNMPITIKKMTQMREEGVVAFIGPDYSCYSEAMVAAAWNFPMITYKCSDRRVSKKDVFSTFARTLAPSSKVSKSVISLLKHFQWDRIVLLVADNPSDKQTADALVALANDQDVRVTGTFYLPGDYLTKYNDTLRSIIERTYMITRVYVVMADTYALVDFVRFMQEKGLLESGDYVIISVEEEEVYDPKKELQYIRREFEVAYDGTVDPIPFRSVLLLTPRAPINTEYSKFQEKVIEYSSMEPFNIPFHPVIKVEVPIYAGLAYDAVLVYAEALTKVLSENKSESDGQAIFEHIHSRPYESILGFSVMMDENGDAEGNYTVMALVDTFTSPDGQNGSSTKRIQPVATFTHQGLTGLPSLRLERPIQWIRGKPPRSQPRCGFKNEFCTYRPDWRLIGICSVCAFILAIAGFFLCRHYRYEHKLACLLWKVDMKDLILLRSDHDDTIQPFRNNFNEFESARLSSTSEPKFEDPVSGRTQSYVGFYKGNAVYIHHVYKKNIDLTRSLRKEMIRIREMRHENINPFIGACVDPPNICILTLFCARGSLQDVLKNTDLHLDTMFVASLVADLVKGMIYIHESEIVSHGNLKSSNCIVDSRWMLKITDFGLHEFQTGQDIPPDVEAIRNKSVLWRAPELLRMINRPARGTQKGDVYSFGIILFEIMGRRGPWGHPEPTLKYIQERVTCPQQFGVKLYRPPIQDLSCADYIKKCMEECWDEDPDARPDFRFIKVKLRELHSGLNNNIFDNMIQIMEKYAYNLETVVKNRTNQLLEEKKKTENLLLRMLPKPVAEQLLKGGQVKAESFDSVTIYFSDIVGFTSLSAVSTPLQVVDLLNDLYTCFDSIIGHYDVYKVETIGDAYMVVSGLPIRNGDRHAGEIASCALRLLEAIRTFEIRHRPGERLSLRIGINSGPCVAGVVGLKMPRYCLFGDTVNTASRMESSGEALKIHVSEACKVILDKIGGYALQERGLTYIKGKGEMRTYWLLGKQNALSNSDPMDRFSSPSQTILPTWLSQPSKTNLVSSLSQDQHRPLPSYMDLLSPSKNDESFNNQLNSSAFNSCLSVYQEYRKSVDKITLRADSSRTSCNGMRSAPIISFREFYSPSHYPTDCLL